MIRRRSTSPRRDSAGIGASERQRTRQPSAKLGTIAESADMASTSEMERQASNSPRRAIAQIRVGRPQRLRQPLRLRTINETAELLNLSSRSVRRLIHSGCATGAPIWPVGTRFRPRYRAADGGKSR